MTELIKIPNVGKKTESVLKAMGYNFAEDIKNVSPEELYRKNCEINGEIVDRCMLYVYRAVHYYLNAENPDSEKSKWQYWMDKYIEPAPCGAICSNCKYFPIDCKGCENIKGKVFWTRFTGDKVCKIYDCCVKDKKLKNCGKCGEFPCNLHHTKDPTVSEEQNTENYNNKLKNLRK